MSKGKRVRITNDSLNSYGTRVLTAGMNVEQYQRNPVLGTLKSWHFCTRIRGVVCPEVNKQPYQT